MNLNITLVIFLIFTIFIVYYSITRIFSLNNKDEYNRNKLLTTVVSSENTPITTQVINEEFSNDIYKPLSLDDRIRELENKEIFSDNDYFNLFLSIFPIDEQIQYRTDIIDILTERDKEKFFILQFPIIYLNTNIPYIVTEIFLLKLILKSMINSEFTMETKEIDNKLYLMKKSLTSGNSNLVYNILDITGLDEWDGNTNIQKTNIPTSTTFSKKRTINITDFIQKNSEWNNIWVNMEQLIEINRKIIHYDNKNCKNDYCDIMNKILTGTLNDYKLNIIEYIKRL
jgi:hypothetical protein